MEFDPGTSQLYVGSWDGFIFAPKGGEDFIETKVALGWAKLMFEPKSQQLLILSRDKYLGLFDPINMSVTSQIYFKEALISGRVSLDGKSVLVGIWDGTVGSVDLETFSENYVFDTGGGIVWDLIEDRTTGYIVTSNNDGKVRIWNPKDRQLVGAPLLISSKAPHVMLYSEKNGLLITGDDDGLVKVWKLPLTKDVEVLKKMVCAGAGDLLRSDWFVQKYGGVELHNLCIEP